MSKVLLPYCSDCGEARIAHGLMKAQFCIEPYILFFCAPLFWIGAHVISLTLRHNLDRYVLWICRTLADIHIGSLVTNLDARDSIRTKALFDGAQAAGVVLYQFRLFNLGNDGLLIAKKDHQYLIFTTMPRPRGFISPSLSWMDDKGKLKQFLLAHGIPTADGGIAINVSGAFSIFDRLGAPVITKPHQGTRGRHTTIGIRTRQELEKAFEITRQISPYVVVEKELSGIVHRVTLVGMRMSAVVKRDYPHIIGDGAHTIADLLESENTDPRRDDFAFFKILPNERADVQLVHHGFTWSSIPQKNERVILNDKVSRLHGTVTIDMTDDVHPDNVLLFNRIGELLGDPIVGIDFMIGDMKKSWKEQPGSGLIECNAMPYIDLHHYPYEGKPRNVAKELWEYIFTHADNSPTI